MTVTWIEDRVAEVRTGARRGRVVGLVVVATVLAAVLGVGWWALGAGHLDTRAVVVTGTQRTDPALVDALGATALGTPLALVDVGAIADGVEELPLVLHAQVVRQWPRTLRVEVEERVAVAAVPAPGGYELLDSEGVVLARSTEPPLEVPVLRVDVALAGAASLEAARSVLGSLPLDVQQRTSDVSADSPADVRLVVDGKDVRWGAATQPEQKLAVLLDLLARVDATTYDVSAPRAPATRP